MRFPTVLTLPVAAIAFTGLASTAPLANALTHETGKGHGSSSEQIALQANAPDSSELIAQAQTQPLNPTIKVGIVQRFGSKDEDRMVIKAQPGERLTVTMDRADGKVDNLDLSQMDIEIVSRPFTQPRLYERLVLSSHRSFESAEDSANQWRSKGIPVEIAQPDGWQVWAERDTYRSPLLRRMLMDEIDAQGIQGPYLDSQIRERFPQASVLAKGYRYNRNHINIASSGRTILVNGVAYPGSLRLQPNSYGSYTLINNVTIEDYLRGVVPHEIGPSAPQNAVEAQTILARTYALRNLRRFTVDNYEMCATTQCQVYIGWKDNVARADAAITATRGLVLTYNNELIDAVYSSTTGGVTAAFTDVWNGAPRPYLQPVIDSVNGSWNLANRSLADEASFRQFIQQRQGFNEEGWNYFRWTQKATLAELNKDLKSYLKKRQNPLANFTTIQSLKVLERAQGGRIQKLQVITDKGEVVLIKDEVIRAFEAPNSLLCYLEPMLDSNQNLTGYQFIGGGLGHGVGLSQTGSYRLAKLGWDRSRILNFYYPNTKLQPLNNSISYWTEPTIPLVEQPQATESNRQTTSETIITDPSETITTETDEANEASEASTGTPQTVEASEPQEAKETIEASETSKTTEANDPPEANETTEADEAIISEPGKTSAPQTVEASKTVPPHETSVTTPAITTPAITAPDKAPPEVATPTTTEEAVGNSAIVDPATLSTPVPDVTPEPLPESVPAQAPLKRPVASPSVATPSPAPTRATAPAPPKTPVFRPVSTPARRSPGRATVMDPAAIPVPRP